MTTSCLSYKNEASATLFSDSTTNVKFFEYLSLDFLHVWMGVNRQYSRKLISGSADSVSSNNCSEMYVL